MQVLGLYYEVLVNEGVDPYTILDNGQKLVNGLADVVEVDSTELWVNEEWEG